MNIVFMGTPQFAVPSLHAILNSTHKISAVVTAPDKPKGRGLKISESPVKQYAIANNLKVLQPAKLKNMEFNEEVENIKPDLIVVVAFRVLPPAVFTLPKFGSINLHASLLPKYRGAAPINRAIMNGEMQTGVTTFFLKEKVDTGSVIMQRSIIILPDDNAGTLHDKLMMLGADVLVETIDAIESTKGNVPVLQQEETLTTPAPKIFKEDCRIIWDVPATNIHNQVRGLSPVPGAFTLYKDKVMKIHKTSLTDVESINSPGELILLKNDIFVSCGDYMLKIEELQPEGKRKMTITEFLAGNKIKKGEKFMY